MPIIEKVLEKIDMLYTHWTVVGANDRNFATLQIITTATQVIETYIEDMTRTPGQQTIKYLYREISSSLNLVPLSWKSRPVQNHLT